MGYDESNWEGLKKYGSQRDNMLCNMMAGNE